MFAEGVVELFRQVPKVFVLLHQGAQRGGGVPVFDVLHVLKGGEDVLAGQQVAVDLVEVGQERLAPSGGYVEGFPIPLVGAGLVRAVELEEQGQVFRLFDPGDLHRQVFDGQYAGQEGVAGVLAGDLPAQEHPGAPAGDDHRYVPPIDPPGEDFACYFREKGFHFVFFLFRDAPLRAVKIPITPDNKKRAVYFVFFPLPAALAFRYL